MAYQKLWLTFAFLIAIWVWLFWGQFDVLLSRWNTDDYSYCYLIPFLTAYLAYTNKDKILANLGGSKIPGYVLLLLSGLLFVSGRVGSLETLVYLSMWASFSGILLILLGGRTWRGLLFPLFVLMFIVPAPPFITNQLTFKLRLISSDISVRVLHFFNFPAYREGNIIDIGVSQLHVVDACSGLRFVVPLVLLGLVMGWMFHTRWWKRGLLTLASLPLAILSNAARVVITAYLVRYVSLEFTEGWIHDAMGWGFFILSLVVLFLLSLLLGQEERGEVIPVRRPGVEREQGRGMWVHGVVVAVLLVLFHVAGSAMVTAQQAPERTSFASFPRNINGWQGTLSRLDPGILESLWADDYVTGSYVNTDTGNQLHLLVPYYETQTTQHTAHAPTSCLLGSGWAVEQKRVVPPDPATGRDFPVTQMRLRLGRQVILSNFWFEMRGRHITSEYLNKLYLIWDALTRQRTDGALVRAEMVLLPGQSVEEGQRVLDTFVVPLKEELQEYIPQ